jgi:hypothetical protein
MKLEIAARRIYFVDAPFSVKDTLKGAGAHWDAERRQWWLGATQKARAEALVAQLAAQPVTRAELPPASAEMSPLEGNTYPIRDQLRSLGGQWDAGAKVWLVPTSRLALAKALLLDAPKSTYRPRQCKQCGARPGPRGWPRIYRNGVCSDCYRDACDEDY